MRIDTSFLLSTVRYPAAADRKRRVFGSESRDICGGGKEAEWAIERSE
jgi:hypothetical protein